MAQKKEPIEIHCSECDAGFRLWIPAEALPEWEEGVQINCIKCGAPHLVEKGRKGFVVSPVEEEPVAERAEAPASRPQAAARKEASAVRPSAAKKEAPAAKLKPAAVEEEAAEIEEEAALEEAPADNVLYIEDDKLSRKMVETVLKDINVRLLAVKNADEALKTLKNEKISLIITDLYLKNPSDPASSMDGEDLLKRVVDLGHKIPAIITTGKAIIDDLELDPKWFDLHVKGFIQKGNPFWAEDLKLKIKETLYRD
jgi:CheY-like chemotaxis protein